MSKHPDLFDDLCYCMVIQLVVWDGTDNADEILEDTFRAIAHHQYGLEPLQLTAVWKGIRAEADRAARLRSALRVAPRKS